MQRDYKPDPGYGKRKPGRRRPGRTVAVLAVTGVVGAALGYVGGFMTQDEPAAATAAPAPAARPTAATPLEVPPKPKYEFYSVLPQRRLDVPQDEPAPPRPVPRAEPAQRAEP
ncbi:MAG: hypothetical protein M3Z21_07360, partial [Pseudomonadota bacterium]|nr:hypothetical protein [Pseudomonadota bacterium]